MPFGVVAVRHERGYLLYSAYNKRFAKIEQQNIDSPQVKGRLEKQGFFAGPAKQVDRTVRVTLIVTTDCNLRCKYCYARAGDHPAYMPLWVAQKAIEYAVPVDTDELFLSFFGGEPTLNFDVIRSVVEQVEVKHIPYTPIISTNGIVNSSVLKFFIEKTFIVKVSLDGTPDMQDKYRVFADGKPTSVMVESTIRTLVREGVRPRVRVTLTRETLCRVKDIVEYLAELGIGTVHMELVTRRGRAKDENFVEPPPDEYVEAIMSAIGHCEKNGIQFVTSALLRLFAPATHYCTSLAGRKLVFTPDGLITSCLETQDCDTAPPEFVIGRYVPEKGTFECDLSQTVPDVRKMMRKCERCSFISICCGGCPIRNFHVTGTIAEVDDWQCKVRKKLLAKVLMLMYDESQQASTQGMSNSVRKLEDGQLSQDC